MTFRVAVSEPAERDADVIYAWLHRRSPQGAVRWWKALLTALERLKEHARDLALAEADHFDEPLRQILFRTGRGRTYRACSSSVVGLSMCYEFVVRGKTVSAVVKSNSLISVLVSRV